MEQKFIERLNKIKEDWCKIASIYYEMTRYKEAKIYEDCAKMLDAVLSSQDKSKNISK